MLVMKFGGTSVGDAKCIAAVREIVAQGVRERAPVVVVVSAMSTVTSGSSTVAVSLIAFSLFEVMPISLSAAAELVALGKV